MAIIKVRNKRFRYRIIGGVIMFSLTLPAFSASTIAPIVVETQADGRAVVNVRNDWEREVMYQLSVLRWQVIDGRDRYEATQDFIASPPIFTLAPAETRAIRIGLRHPIPAPVEQVYRLVVAEVPRVDEFGKQGGMVSFALQYLLPVYVASTLGDAKPELVWSMQAVSDAVVVRAENIGQKRIVLLSVGLSKNSSENVEPEFISKKPTNVLAKTWREWRIPVPPGKASLPLHIVYLNQGSTNPTVVPNAEIRASSSR
ncbi:P pilus assembly chaperone PapD [Gammaproteobacteria bacterium]